MRFCFAMILFSLVCQTSYSKEPEKSGQTALEVILNTEASGQSIDRRFQLLDQKVGLTDQARWQMGQVKIDNTWANFEDCVDRSPSPTIAKYKILRSESSGGADGQRDLAKWCYKNSLHDQERAHWYGVIKYLPNDLEARTHLGDRWIDGRWYTPSEQRAIESGAKSLQADWKKWMPKMRGIVNELNSNNAQAKQRALKELGTIDSQSAIPALEVTAIQLPANMAIPFVRTISKMNSTEACLACCRIYLERSDEQSNQMTVDLIKQFPIESYVPELLSLLATPIETEMRFEVNAQGEMLIRRAMFREIKNEKQFLELERLVRVSSPVTQGEVIHSTISVFRIKQAMTASKTPSSFAASPNQIVADELAASKNALEDQVQFQQQVAQANESNQELSKRVSSLLRKTTGENNNETPESWWTWWRNYNERDDGRKPLAKRSYREIDPTRFTVGYALLGSTSTSCLVEGTQIQTDDGMKPIESIQIGDKVLSQNVETGELAIKPVLQTTIRPPKSTMRIEIESGVIQATAGHRWFVAGQGWLMTKELEPDMLLHTASRTTRILGVTEAPETEVTYNLVVADFNTYFVGEDRVLSFDNSEPKPTLRTVPGFGNLLAKSDCGDCGTRMKAATSGAGNGDK